ncbi:23730_t:CDS:2 [Cetraspora pellucida]|uniref:23730_t:CDS:1 n=1 Tax=Cetraspora pellucida TaxID=1433469 RepID=A0A9N9E4S0_9GLOM|nr:23730_t:CDS:2 [Cetraspora pellucida]
MMVNAKCAAMLASLHKITVFLVGALVQYIVAQVSNFINSRKEIDKEWDDNRLTTSNDYAMYVQSQTHETVHFEDLLHRHVNAPEFLRKYYVYLKNTTLTQHGCLSTQRVTGGAETYDYNAYVNIAYTNLKILHSS